MMCNVFILADSHTKNNNQIFSRGYGWGDKPEAVNNG